MEKNRKYIDDMVVINVIEDSKEDTKDLVRSKENTLVYHTGTEEIFIEVKNIRAYRGVI